MARARWPELSVLLQSALVLLQQAGVREALPTEAAEVRPLSCVHLHVKLYVCELTETQVTHVALVRLVASVDEQVFGVVGADSKGLPAVLTLVGLLPCVLQCVVLEGLAVDEGFITQFALEGPLPCVQAQVVVIRGFVEEGFLTQVTLVLLGLRVDQLVFEQSAGVLKAAVTGLTAEGRHIQSALVHPHDHSALYRSVQTSACAPRTRRLLMDLFLVSLELAVVEEGASTQVTHEGLGGSVDQHVGLELVLDKGLATDLALVGSLPTVDAHVAFQILLKGEAGSTDLADDASAVVHRLVHLQRPLLLKDLVTLGALEGLFDVGAFMPLEGSATWKTLCALRAVQTLLVTVQSLVCTQVGLVLEKFPTGGTREGYGVIVQPLVGFQGHFAFERLVTDGALERPEVFLTVVM